MHRPMYRLALLVVLAGLVVPASAGAAPLPESHATGPFLDAAKAYWARMLPGRQPPCPTVLVFVDEQHMEAKGWDSGNTAIGDIWGCHIWIKRSFWASYDVSDPVSNQVLCTTVVHEYGHNLGLGHTSNYPVMTNEVIPHECGGPPDQGNPHRDLTTFLYGRKEHLWRAIRHNRQVGLCTGRPGARRCKPLLRRLNRVLDQLAALEGVWRR